MVAEPHPDSPDWFHLHGVWRVRREKLYRGWWRDLKEFLWEVCGKAYVHDFPVGNPQAKMEQLSYCLKHAVKCARRLSDSKWKAGEWSWWDHWQCPQWTP